MAGYTKLFASIVGSSIWEEDNATRIVWITMLAMKDEHHMVNVSNERSLARLAQVTTKECERAIAKLSAPDPIRPDQPNEGRRIERTSDGWLILNGEKYRRKLNREERREYMRIKKQEWRARQLAVNNGLTSNVKEMSTKSKTSRQVNTTEEEQNRTEQNIKGGIEDIHTKEEEEDNGEISASASQSIFDKGNDTTYEKLEEHCGIEIVREACAAANECDVIQEPGRIEWIKVRLRDKFKENPKPSPDPMKRRFDE